MLKIISRKILKKYNPDVVGISGSLGKTSVKDISVQILKKKFRTRGSLDSYNTRIGVPLAIIGKKSPNHSFWGWLNVLLRGVILCLKTDKFYPEVLVLEMAANRPGDMKYFSELSSCNVGVVTAVSPVHLKFFKTIKKLFREKRLLVSNLEKTGYAILNRDDKDVYMMRKKTDADIISYGFHPGSTVRASDVHYKFDRQTNWPQGVFFKVIHKGSVVPVYLPHVVGEHIIYPVLAAISIAVVFGLNLVEISRALQEICMPAGRMRILPGIKGTLLIDDSYNASPDSMKAALHTFSNIFVERDCRRIAVIGDMLELGSQSDRYHKEIGIRIHELKIDFLITVGPSAKAAARSAVDVGLNPDRVASFDNRVQAGLFLQQKLNKGDIILLKGSRAMSMEKIVKEVVADPTRTDHILSTLTKEPL